MTTLVDIDFEAGDLAEFTSTVTDSGDLSAHADAALAGTNYGMKLVLDDTTAIYGIINCAAPVSGVLRTRFYIDPNSLTMANNDVFTLCGFYNGTTQRARINFYRSGSTYLFFFALQDDAGTFGIASSIIVPDAPTLVEWLVKKATTADSNDGTITCWLDGVQMATKADIDCYTNFATIDAFRFGAVIGVDATTSGTFYLDQLVITDTNTRIGRYGGGTNPVRIVPEVGNVR